MLILSQDREKIINSNLTSKIWYELDEKDEQYRNIYSCGNVVITCLGKYPKERAKQVFNDLYKVLALDDFINFEMPKE